MIQLRNKVYTCPVDVTLSFIGGKWKILILSALHWNPELGFAEIRKNLPKVSDKVLSEQLTEMEKDKLIRKRTISAKPFRVAYKLTSYGATLSPVVDLLSKWGVDYLKKNGIDYLQDQAIYKDIPA